MPTYRQLLEAIAEAEKLKANAESAASNSARWKGSVDMRDRAEAWVRETDSLLDLEIGWS